ncbi:DUF2474 domain-containing protein [Rouxiella badensis]|jgi:hypothetical protein|uniref:DUF2474 domain-containing protein n=1 Tax=Rouxiella badensis TaxID=1646377 RepID=A0A1X0WIB4_9GAMM|nr:DUF2474 domain-containing protein [Rouxiella badensis]
MKSLITIQQMDDKTVPAKSVSFWKKISWLVLIYGGSVLALLVVASAFHILMFAAGMKTHG